MPTPHYDNHGVTVYHGDCLEVLRDLPAASVDSVVTDPPYGLEFMGKEWDSFRGEAWRSGAGMSKPGIGERKTEWVSFGGADSANATCEVCGGRMRGAKKCPTPESEDHEPDWRVKGKPLEERNSRKEFGRAFQRWCEAWSDECLRVLKPGGHMLAFGGTRTYHRLACAIEDAGFEIRDSIAWLQGQGFPKSLDVSKAIDKAAGAEREIVGVRRTGAAFAEGAPRDSSGSHIWTGNFTSTNPATPEAAQWQGWGTALRPCHEPIIVARKPLEGTVAANVLKHGTGALNIDATRISAVDAVSSVPRGRFAGSNNNMAMNGRNGTMSEPHAAGRWPANVMLDEKIAEALDAQSGDRKAGGKVAGTEPSRTGESGIYGAWNRVENQPYEDNGGASRFFFVSHDLPPFIYSPKARSTERPLVGGVNHVTVKPLDLMRQLVRLVTPPGGLVLDPFGGSGTTAEACVIEGFRCITIEQDESYLPLIVSRVARQRDPVAHTRLTKTEDDAPTLFDDL